MNELLKFLSFDQLLSIVEKQKDGVLYGEEVNGCFCNIYKVLPNTYINLTEICFHFYIYPSFNASEKAKHEERLDEFLIFYSEIETIKNTLFSAKLDILLK